MTTTGTTIDVSGVTHVIGAGGIPVPLDVAQSASRDALSSLCRGLLGESESWRQYLAQDASLRQHFADEAARISALAAPMTGKARDMLAALSPVLADMQRWQDSTASLVESLTVGLAPGVARARDLARAGVQALHLARGVDALAVDIARLLRSELDAGHEATAATIARALDGDEDALRDLHDIAQDSTPDKFRELARRALGIVARLVDLAAEWDRLLDAVAGLLAPALVSEVEEYLEPPPRQRATASQETTGPPPRIVRGRGGHLSTNARTEPGARHRYDP